MRRQFVLLSAVLLAACNDLPLEPYNKVPAAGSTSALVAGSSAISSVTWIKSSTGIDMIDLGRFNDRDVFPLDINAAGQVVGYFSLPTPTGTRTRAFLWKDGVFTDLGTLGGYASVAQHINEAGVIVGWAAKEGEARRPVVWQNGQIRELPQPNGESANTGDARAINEAGEIVGTYRNRAVKWTTSNVAVLLGLAPGTNRAGAQAINNTGRIMGTSTILSPFSRPPFIHENGAMSTPSLPADASLAAIWLESSRVLNDAGHYVGTIINSSNFTQRGFVVRDGEVHMLPSVIEGSTGEFVIGLGINEHADVAGLEFGPNGVQHAVVWRRSGPAVKLGVGPGGYHGQGRGINKDGLVVGTSSTSGISEVTKTSGAIWRLPAPDATPPVITASVSGTLGANGWYVSDVQVSWTMVDAESGVGSSSGCETVRVTSDTQGASYTCTATNGAGVSASETVVVKRDATAPLVAYDSHAASYTVDQYISIGCSATDAMSGIESHSCEPIAGDAYAFGVGSHTFTATAVDRAGNGASASTSFSVDVTFASLIALTRRFVTDPREAEQLVKFVKAAEEAYDRGHTPLAQVLLKVYAQQVKMQVGKTVSAEHGALLVQLANTLSAGLDPSRDAIKKFIGQIVAGVRP